MSASDSVFDFNTLLTSHNDAYQSNTHSLITCSRTRQGIKIGKCLIVRMLNGKENFLECSRLRVRIWRSWGIENSILYLFSEAAIGYWRENRWVRGRQSGGMQHGYVNTVNDSQTGVLHSSSSYWDVVSLVVNVYRKKHEEGSLLTTQVVWTNVHYFLCPSPVSTLFQYLCPTMPFSRPYSLISVGH